MDKSTISKWISKRKASIDYIRFILADYFYAGYAVSSEVFMDWVKGGIPDDLCNFEFTPLVYNSLRRNTKKKKNYLLARPYTVTGNKQVIDYIQSIIPELKQTVEELYKKSEVWWEFEPNNDSPIKFRIIVRCAQDIVPHYTNKEETEYDSVGYLWNKIDDSNNITRYADFVDKESRYRFILGADSEEVEKLPHALKNDKDMTFSSLPFVRLTVDGLYDEIKFLGKMYSDRYCQADALIEDSADPVALVKNASDTDSQILLDDIKQNKVVKVEGTGDFSYVSKSADYSSIQSFMSVLKSDIFDLCGVVSREQELSYVTSGRALDRLYVDMDNDAAEMGSVLREALKVFLTFVSAETKQDYSKDFDIIFNTDKPTDEQQIISNISSSSSLLSKRTLLEQHPWVDDVDKELERLEDEKETPEPEPTPIPDEVTEEIVDEESENDKDSSQDRNRDTEQEVQE